MNVGKLINLLKQEDHYALAFVVGANSHGVEEIKEIEQINIIKTSFNYDAEVNRR